MNPNKFFLDNDTNIMDILDRLREIYTDIQSLQLDMINTDINCPLELKNAREILRRYGILEKKDPIIAYRLCMENLNNEFDLLLNIFSTQDYKKILLEEYIELVNSGSNMKESYYWKMNFLLVIARKLGFNLGEKYILYSKGIEDPFEEKSGYDEEVLFELFTNIGVANKIKNINSLNLSSIFKMSYILWSEKIINSDNGKWIFDASNAKTVELVNNLGTSLYRAYSKLTDENHKSISLNEVEWFSLPTKSELDQIEIIPKGAVSVRDQRALKINIYMVDKFRNHLAHDNLEISPSGNILFKFEQSELEDTNRGKTVLNLFANENLREIIMPEDREMAAAKDEYLSKVQQYKSKHPNRNDFSQFKSQCFRSHHFKYLWENYAYFGDVNDTNYSALVDYYYYIDVIMSANLKRLNLSGEDVCYSNYYLVPLVSYIEVLDNTEEWNLYNSAILSLVELTDNGDGFVKNLSSADERIRRIINEKLIVFERQLPKDKKILFLNQKGDITDFAVERFKSGCSWEEVFFELNRKICNVIGDDSVDLLSEILSDDVHKKFKPLFDKLLEQLLPLFLPENRKQKVRKLRKLFSRTLYLISEKVYSSNSKRSYKIEDIRIILKQLEFLVAENALFEHRGRITSLFEIIFANIDQFVYEDLEDNIFINNRKREILTKIRNGALHGNISLEVSNVPNLTSNINVCFDDNGNKVKIDHTELFIDINSVIQGNEHLQLSTFRVPVSKDYRVYKIDNDGKYKKVLFKAVCEHIYYYIHYLNNKKCGPYVQILIDRLDCGIDTFSISELYTIYESTVNGDFEEYAKNEYRKMVRKNIEESIKKGR